MWHQDNYGVRCTPYDVYGFRVCSVFVQLICEAYQLMKDGLGMNCDEMSLVH